MCKANRAVRVASVLAVGEKKKSLLPTSTPWCNLYIPVLDGDAWAQQSRNKEAQFFASALELMLIMRQVARFSENNVNIYLKNAGNRSPEVEYLLFLPHSFAFIVCPAWSELTSDPSLCVSSRALECGARHICPRLGSGGCVGWFVSLVFNWRSCSAAGVRRDRKSVV